MMCSGAAQARTPALLSADSRFIVGPENSLIRELALAAISERPKYNPLVLYGAIGVGKSTLAHLLADQRQASLRLVSALRTTAAELVQALAHAADTNSVADLRAQYHRCDLLLIDDLQGLADRPAAQQFLVTTLDALVRRGVLVIATLRKLPAESPWLAPALASRLSAGLVVPLAPPAVLARQEIVRQLAAQLSVRLTDDQVIQLAGARGGRLGSTTVPQFRHALMQRAALAHELINEPPADDADTFRHAASAATNAVARHYRLSVGQLKSKSRRQHLVEARNLAMYLCRELTGASYLAIGRYFGHRDHSTVLHACRKTRETLAADPGARRIADDLLTQITTEPSRT